MAAEPQSGDPVSAKAFVLRNPDAIKKICAELRKRQGIETELPKGLHL